MACVCALQTLMKGTMYAFQARRHRHRHHHHHQRAIAPLALRLVSDPYLECRRKLLTRVGKCYTWTFPNGERFGYNAHGWYTASKESRHQQFGKFRLCKDKNCLPGAINPGEGFSAQDVHGQANGKIECSGRRDDSDNLVGGQNPNQWVDGKQNGGHIGKTPDYAKSGKFTITKWPCGKYCLGGLDAGLGKLFSYAIEIYQD
jgi:hypothetical protein